MSEERLVSVTDVPADLDLACGCVKHRGQKAPEWTETPGKLGWIGRCPTHEAAFRFGQRAESARAADRTILALHERAARERKFVVQLKAEVDEEAQAIAALRERAFDWDDAAEKIAERLGALARAFGGVERSLGEIERATRAALDAASPPPSAPEE